MSAPAIIDFILKEIDLGHARGEILAKVVKKWRISDRTFDRHWKKANEQKEAAREKLRQELEQLEKESAIAARKKAIMSAEDRKVYLTKIIEGKVKVKYKEVKWNPTTLAWQTIDLVELASHTARISAISELNKMDGDYAPTKIANTDTAGKNIPPPTSTPVYILRLPPGVDINLPSNTDGEG